VDGEGVPVAHAVTGTLAWARRNWIRTEMGVGGAGDYVLTFSSWCYLALSFLSLVACSLLCFPVSCDCPVPAIGKGHPTAVCPWKGSSLKWLGIARGPGPGKRQIWGPQERRTWQEGPGVGDK
jgi:hypothetical protein